MDFNVALTSISFLAGGFRKRQYSAFKQNATIFLYYSHFKGSSFKGKSELYIDDKSRWASARRTPLSCHSDITSHMSPEQVSPPIAALIRTEASTHPVIAGEVDHSQTEERCRTKWLCLQTLTYRSGHDKKTSYARHWDMAKRATRSAESTTDAVVILTRLRLADDVPRIVLVKQFRPPMDGVTVELPAGLVDPDESVEQAALRELREETGFTGTVTAVHPPAPLSPGLSSETVVLVEVDVNGATQGQHLTSSENIHVVSVPIARLSEALTYMSESEGVHIMHPVSTIAAGLSLATSVSSS